MEKCKEKVKLDDLVGKTIVSVENLEVDEDKISIKTSDGFEYELEACIGGCGFSCIEEIDGDISLIIGSPITYFEVNVSDDTGYVSHEIKTEHGCVIFGWYKHYCCEDSYIGMPELFIVKRPE